MPQPTTAVEYKLSPRFASILGRVLRDYDLESVRIIYGIPRWLEKMSVAEGGADEQTYRNRVYINDEVFDAGGLRFFLAVVHGVVHACQWQEVGDRLYTDYANWMWLGYEENPFEAVAFALERRIVRAVRQEEQDGAD